MSRGLSQPLTALSGIGPQLASRLEGLGIRCIRDLLFHLPLRYEDRRRFVPLARLSPDREALVRGRIEQVEQRAGGRRSLLATVGDGSGRLRLRWFHYSRAQAAQIRSGRWIRAFGTVRAGRHGLEMVHPEYRLADSESALVPEATLTPVYPLTAGITQARMRSLIGRALELAVGDPELALATPGLPAPDTLEALRSIHRPASDADLELLARGRHPAQLRLIREELLAHQLCMRVLRRRVRSQPAAPIDGFDGTLAALRPHFGFAPTGAQQRVIGEIAADCARSVPMMRLVQGDVGSGKTAVAAVALAAAARAGWQAALMAPTELLAEQHAGTLRQWLEPLGIEVALLSGRLKGAARRKALAQVAEGQVPVVVGTHAVFQDAVRFSRLALVVVDEQHRFGVQQRLALRDKGPDGMAVHQLVMTATPIPRTLAQTVYADLDLSVIDELPPGRSPVRTVAVSSVRRAEVAARVGAACRAGRQAYWVCTLIDSSEALEAEAAEQTVEEVRAALPDLRVGLVHGRMKPAEKQQVMERFKAGEIQLLVATTVIEVGVDVPNASIMVIDNAERLGLAQLHQLRGRVGRGARESQCVLLYHPPLSDTARRRLAVMRRTTDGFEIARADLELRGPGEILGRRQTGVVGLKVAEPVRDAPLIGELQPLADRWLSECPEAATALVRRWVGDLERYGQV